MTILAGYNVEIDSILKLYFSLIEMDAITSAKKKAKEKKKKQQTPIVGDLTEMEEALPTLELLLKKSTHSAVKR